MHTATKYRIVLAIAVFAAAPAAARAQQTVEVDLAKSSAQTRPAPGPEIQFRIVNRLPGKDYKISVVDRIIEIDAFIAPTGTRTAGGDKCSDLLLQAENLDVTPAKGGPKDEADVATRVKAIDAALANGDCKDGAVVQSIGVAVAKTRLDVSGTFHVADGHELVLTASRQEGDKPLTWTMTVQGASRGKWITTYGLAFVPDKDEKYFTAAAADKFTITAEARRGGLKPLPAVFFTWLPRSRQDADLVVGPTAGFGLEGGNRPAVFGGLSLTYNWNLGFVAGAGVVPERRLTGRYEAGQIIATDLSSEALHTNVVEVRWLFAFTFRFGSNPFAQPPAAPAATAGKH